MTELEKLRADLATIQKAAQIAKEAGFHRRTGTYDMVEEDLKQKIAKLEAQKQVDPWKRAKEALYHWDQNDKEPDYITKRSIFAYIQSLQAKVAELDYELRCERIDGGKVRDDLRTEIAELKAKAKREQLDLCEECGYPLSDCGPPSVDGTPTTDCKACQHRAKTTDWAWAKHLTSVFLHHRYDGENIWLLATYAKHLEEQLSKATIRNFRTVEQLRETLAELTTIQNAIPAACGLAKELVEKRIDGVKKEIQDNG